MSRHHSGVIIKSLILLALASLPIRAQVVGSPIMSAAAFGPFFDNNGNIMSGGKICTYAAGTTTPLAAYTDSSLTVQQTNPVTLNSVGRPQGGGVYIGTVAYKFVWIQGGNANDCTTGTIVWTQDRVTNGATVINGFSGNITIAGTVGQITVTNASNTVTISVPANMINTEFTCTASGSSICFNSPNLEISGSGYISTSNGGGGIFSGYVDTAIWYGMLPTATTPTTTPGGGYSAFTLAGGTNAWIYDGITTHAWTLVNLAGGVGGGGATGPTNSVQINVGGTSTGQASLIYNPSTEIMTITGTGGSGYQGPVFSSSATGTNTAFTDVGGNFIINGNGVAAFQSESTTSGWTIAATSYGITGSGVLTVASCSGCGGSGSPGSPTNSIQFNGPFGTGGTFTGNSGFTVSEVSPDFHVLITGSNQSGFEGPVFSCTNTSTANCVTDVGSNFLIQANGNAAFQAVALTNGWSIAATSYGITAGGVLTVSSCSGCGGSGSPGSPTNAIQFNGPFGTGGSFTGNSAFTVSEVTPDFHVLITGSTSSGFEGPVFSCTNTGSANCLTDIGSNFLITGAGNAAFQSLALTNGVTVDSGAYGLNGSGVLTVASCTGCGATSSINGLTGAVNIIQGTGVTITTASPNITVAIGQPVAPSSSPTFTNVVANGTFNSTATGTASAFQTSSGTFIVEGDGTVGGQISNFNEYFISSNLVIDASRNATFNNITIQGTCTGCSASGVSAVFGTPNEVSVSANTGSVTFSTPQPIASTSNVNFGSLAIGGNTIITSSGAILAPSGQNIQTGAVYAVSGGFFGASGSIVIGGCTIFIQGGIVYNHTGC